MYVCMRERGEKEREERESCPTFINSKIHKISTSRTMENIFYRNKLFYRKWFDHILIYC